MSERVKECLGGRLTQNDGQLTTLSCDVFTLTDIWNNCVSGINFYVCLKHISRQGCQLSFIWWESSAKTLFLPPH